MALRLTILFLATAHIASSGFAQGHYRGAAGSGSQSQAPQNSSQMMQQKGQQQQQQGGGGQQGGPSKSREAAEKSIKDGDEVRKAITKTSEQFAQGANKLVENFNSTISSMAKSASEGDAGELLKQIKEVGTATALATTTVVDEIVSGYKAQADLLVKKAQMEAAAIVAVPKEEPMVKFTTMEKLSGASGFRGGGSALGDVMAVSSAAAENIPSLSGGAAITRQPGSFASTQGPTEPASSSGGASAPPPTIGTHAKGVR